MRARMNMFRNSVKWLSVTLVLAAVVVAASTAATAQGYVYNLTDLTYGITADCHPAGANDSGQAVGNGAVPYLTSVATGFVDLSSVLSAANGINNGGVIAGCTSDASGNSYAVTYSGGTATTLGLGTATAINNADQVVGTGPTLSNGDSHAYLYSGGVATDLGVLYGKTNDWASSWATAINSSGMIVGASMYGANYTGAYFQNHAFLYSNSTMQDLGTLGGPNSQACGINDAGVVVGSADTAQTNFGIPVTVPFLWDGTMHNLGTFPDSGYLGGQANGINSSNQVVGWSYNASGVPEGFLYQNGQMLHLDNMIDPNSGWNIDQAIAISNTGVILAMADNSNVDPDGFGWGHTVLLTPLAGDANLDGQVDINDLTIVLANYGKASATWFEGDLNGDGRVDINDLTTVLANYGTSYGAAAPTAAVPEPSCIALLGLVPLGWLAFARRKRDA